MNTLNVGFIGHVDNGKSTVAGNILALTNNISDEELNKNKKLSFENKKESWYHAYSLDILESERKRGKTIEYTIIPIVYENIKINLIDNPGHKDYIKNLIDGLVLTDIVIIIVSIKENENDVIFSEKGTLKEQIGIAYGLGKRNFIVLINKMDCVDWNENKFIETKKKIQQWMKPHNINPDYIPISGYYGNNLIEIDKNITWNTMTLLSSLKKFKNLNLNDDKFIGQIFSRDGDNNVEFKVIKKSEKMPNFISSSNIKIKIPYFLGLNNNKVEYSDIVYGDILKINDKKQLLKKNEIICDEGLIIKKYKELNLSVQFINMKYTNIISEGFLCTLYVNTNIYNVEILNIKDKIFISKNSKEIVKIKILNDEEITVIDDVFYKKIILRKNHENVGFGEII